MKFKIQGKWQEESESFSKTEFQVKETNGTVRGRFIKKRKNGDKWVFATMTFVAFKSSVEETTINALLNHGGNFLEVEGDLIPELAKDGKTYWCFVVNKARHAEIDDHSKAKGNGYQSQQEEMEGSIPF